MSRDALLDNILSSASAREDMETGELEKKYEAATSDKLKEEYKKLIKQKELYQKAYVTVKEQKELIKIKIKNAITSLKCFQLGLADMGEIISNEDKSSINTFQNTVDDLAEYNENLK